VSVKRQSATAKGQEKDDSAPDKCRIDKWLWAARFFKTRNIASDAIAKNRVQVGGQRVKASRTVAPGDHVSVEKGPYRFDVTVLGITDQRRGAVEAQALYAELDESRERRQALAARLRADRESRLGLAGEGRPNKKQRRQIIRFQNRNDGDVVPDE